MLVRVGEERGEGRGVYGVVRHSIRRYVTRDPFLEKGLLRVEGRFLEIGDSSWTGLVS